MEKLSANQIRETFLHFFQSKGHAVIPSDSVVPKEDPTVLFTTAGMQQFKRQFLGDIGEFTRAATSQKCIRTDDLDEVGGTPFHHTFFEMLGNFSFGDYFKKEAILWAWEFLTGELGIPASRLWVSVYHEDQEAYDIWKNVIGLSSARIFRLGDKSNFWPSNAKQDGPNGPCGPCSEIFFDYQPDSPQVPLDPDDIPGRFAEVWNLVFTQFNRRDGGQLEALPKKNIDTGMGLERLCAVMQGVQGNFETDLFVPVLEGIAKEIPAELPVKDQRIIADHIRAAAFAINDGIIPSNKERGSVVKNLINRSLNLVFKAGGPQVPCVFKIVPAIAEVMRVPYPEIAENSRQIMELIGRAEEAFVQVWKTRVPELRQKIQDQPDADTLGRIFFLYQDTFGLPFATSLLIAQEERAHADTLQKAVLVYGRLMAEQKELSRASSKMSGDVFCDAELDLAVPKTRFLGYEQEQAEATVLRIFEGNESVDRAAAGAHVRIVLDQTPLYAESGGQSGDHGEIRTLDSGPAVVKVGDTQKLADVFLHSVDVESGEIAVGDRVAVKIEHERRKAIACNHTATHLLQAALRSVLGAHVQQQGSAVDDSRLRFDFTHPRALTDEQKTLVEDYVNRMIHEDILVEKAGMTLNEARQKGALAFFAEKYGETVRVVHVPGCSAELCGGTHADHTGEIRLFKIVSEGAIAQGIRRIEGATASAAEAVNELKRQREQETLENLQRKEREKQEQEELFKSLQKALPAIAADCQPVNGTLIVPHVYDNVSIDILRRLSDAAKMTASSVAVVFASRMDDKSSLIVALTDDLVREGAHAGDLVKKIMPMINGSGGGRPQFAQAGGKDTAHVGQAVDACVKQIQAICEKRAS